jgi:hypothetical protein
VAAVESEPLIRLGWDRLARTMHPADAVQRLVTACALLSLAAAAAACGGTTSTELGGPSSLRCDARVNAPSGQVPSGGANLAVTIGAARDCLWSAASETGWLDVSPSDGQGDGTVVVTVAPNTQTTARSGRVVINGTRITLTQAGAAPACRIELSHREGHAAHEGARVHVDVSAPAGCGWQVSSPVSWIAPRPASGAGPGRVELEVAANTGAARTAPVTIAGTTVTLTQDAAPADAGGSPGGGPVPPGTPPPGPAIPPPAASCVFTLSPSSASFGEGGGHGSFRVTTGNDCAWSVSSGAPWVTIRGGASGRGNGEVLYQVERNGAAQARTAVVRVADRDHTITQAAGRPQRVEIEGRVSNLSGSCPNRSFTVRGWTVITDSQTRYDDGRCTTLRNGIEVEVDGEVIGENQLRAREIEFD